MTSRQNEPARCTPACACITSLCEQSMAAGLNATSALPAGLSAEGHILGVRSLTLLFDCWPVTSLMLWLHTTQCTSLLTALYCRLCATLLCHMQLSKSASIFWISSSHCHATGMACKIVLCVYMCQKISWCECSSHRQSCQADCKYSLHPQSVLPNRRHNLRLLIG